MKLQFDSITFRNFLTFGAVEQTIDFTKGLNVVMGMDVERNRSNGSGKSSCLLTIPFALFGKTDKDVNKAGLINWKNKKNCMVSLSFSKGDVKYRVVRCLKPDSLEIYRDNVLIPLPSDVREYQKMFESDILGFDLQTFTSLIHTNLNSVQPILKMSVPEKRKFLERMFGLEMFSNLVSRGNEKIRSIQESISNHRLQQDFNNRAITEQEEQLRKHTIRLNGLPNTANEIRDLKERILAMEDKYEGPAGRTVTLGYKVAESEARLADKLKYQIIVNAEYDKIKSELQIFNNQLKNYGNIEKDMELLHTARKDLFNLTHGGQSITQTDLDLAELTLAELRVKGEGYSKVITDLKIEQQSISSDLKNLKEKLDLLAGDKCPTCQSELKDNDLLNSLKAECGKKHRLSMVNNGELSAAEIQQKWNMDSILGYINKVGSTKATLKEVNRLQSIIEKLMVSEMQHAAYIQVKLDIIQRERLLGIELEKIQVVKVEITRYQNIIKSCTDELESLQSAVSMLSSLKDQLSRLELKLQEDVWIVYDIQNMINDCEQKIKELTGINRDATNKINKLNDLLDYVQYVKEMCQDDGVKQFAVSNTMPYLTSRVNYYLSESGCNFYIKLTGWLEEEIMGAGITNCTYGNLSGGETRSIDIALQLAFLDIARIKAGVYPDLMVFDELLDSSVDGPGITSMMKIIKTLQREIDGKVFLITHRSEISDIDIDNLYVVEKSGGFSHVRKV